MDLTQRDFRKVVIDTAPLLDALAIDLAVHRQQWAPLISRTSPLTDFLERDPLKRKRFLQLLDNIGEMIITSHVIGEIRRERYVNPPDFHAAYWSHCLEFFSRHNVREELVTLADLNRDEKTKQIVCEFGPVDAGLMVLANREKCYLLTNDDNWYGVLGIFGNLEIKLIKNLLDF